MLHGIFEFRSLFVLYLLFVCGLMRTSLALAIASISSGLAKRMLYPLKAPAALGTMWRTQRSGAAGRTNRGFLAQCQPNPQVYPSHKTTRLSRRSCVLPQPAQATAISGSPFLFLLTVEILICDSSHEFSNRIPFSFATFSNADFWFRRIDVRWYPLLRNLHLCPKLLHYL